MPRRILVLLVGGLAVLTGCGRSHPAAYTTQAGLPGAGAPPIVLKAVAFDLRAAGPVPAPVANQAWVGVLDTLNRYVQAAVVTPLRSGGPAGDLRPLFTGPAADRVVAGGPDRFVLIDENLPPVADLRPNVATVGFTGLAGSDGTMSVITAGVDLRVTGQVGGRPVTIVRTGELVLVPEGAGWRIDAYDITVTRTRADGGATTTTAHS